jgi:hypothetical protein
MKKIAIVIMSDPKNGSEESTGRALNALALAHECKRAGDEVALLFKGAGTRWPERLSRLDHPANARYNDVRDTVRGASRACAVHFGAADGVVAAGVDLISDAPLPGTPGLLGLRPYLGDGWETVIF